MLRSPTQISRTRDVVYRQWVRAEPLVLCTVHLSNSSTHRMHACLSQCYIRIAADEGPSDNQAELLDNAVAHADLAVQKDPTDAVTLMAAIHAQLCTNKSDSARPLVARLKRMPCVDLEKTIVLRNTARQCNHGWLSYELSRVILFQTSQQHQGTGDNLTGATAQQRRLPTQSDHVQLLHAHTHVLKDGVSLLGPSILQNAPNMAPMLHYPITFTNGSCPCSKQEASQVLSTLMGHAATLEDILHDLRGCSKVCTVDVRCQTWALQRELLGLLS
jgi:hypothetical protein